MSPNSNACWTSAESLVGILNILVMAYSRHKLCPLNHYICVSLLLAVHYFESGLLLSVDLSAFESVWRIVHAVFWNLYLFLCFSSFCGW